MTRMTLPGAVRGLMVTHDQEGLRLVAGFVQKVDSLVGDNVRSVPNLVMRPFGRDERWVEVLALPRNDLPMVEPTRLMSLALPQVPFADHCRRVSTRTKCFSDIRKHGVNLRSEGQDAVDVIVRAG